MKRFSRYLLPTLLCFVVGWIASIFQSDALVEWYPYLVKSPLPPPAILFPIVWTVLYILIGASLGVMLVRRDVGLVKLWLVQLILNFLWSAMFFGVRSPLLGLITILLLDVVVFAYVVSCIGRRSLAMWLFLPYLIWLLFATYLNGAIYLLN
jgi:tryptophan-rich sensory protein